MNLKKEKKRKDEIKIEIYSKADCHLCEIAKEVLQRVGKQYHAHFEEIDITSDPDLYVKFSEQIPVIFINGKKAFKYRIDEAQLHNKLSRLI